MNLLRNNIIIPLFLGIFVTLALVNSYIGTPQPWVTDEFSYLLAADTFIHGRVTNPQHALPQFFENAHIIITPSYMSKYPPGQAAFMALGKLLFDEYFYGVLLALALFCVSFYWMAASFISRNFALGGSIILTLMLELNSGWGRSFVPGALPAAAACLALGSYFYSYKQGKAAKPFQFAIAMIILSLTRPYEGAILLISLGLFFIYDWHKKNIGNSNLKSFLVIIFAGFVASLLLNAGYNYYVTGNYFTLPNQLHIKQYMYAPYFWFKGLLKPQLIPSTYIVQQLYTTWEKQFYIDFNAKEISEKIIFLSTRIFVSYSLILAGLSALALFFKKDKAPAAMRLLYLLIISLFFSSLILWLLNYYVFSAIVISIFFNFYVFEQIYIQATDRNKQTGLSFLFRLVYLISMLSLTAYVACVALGGAAAYKSNYYNVLFQMPVTKRMNIEKEIERGNHYNLVFVHYGNYKPELYKSSSAMVYNLALTYVYNGAEIDSKKTVFAHDLGKTENNKLIIYYDSLNQDRQLWRLDLTDPAKPVLNTY